MRLRPPESRFRRTALWFGSVWAPPRHGLMALAPSIRIARGTLPCLGIMEHRIAPLRRPHLIGVVVVTVEDSAPKLLICCCQRSLETPVFNAKHRTRSQHPVVAGDQRHILLLTGSTDQATVHRIALNPVQRIRSIWRQIHHPGDDFIITHAVIFQHRQCLLATAMVLGQLVMVAEGAIRPMGLSHKLQKVRATFIDPVHPSQDVDVHDNGLTRTRRKAPPFRAGI